MLWTAFLPLLLGIPAYDCEYTATRTATVPAADATLLRLRAAAGSLRVEGRDGLTEVRVRGTACASAADVLDAIQLEAAREGAEVRVAAVLPEHDGDAWRDHYARLDLVVEVPRSLPLDVRDSSGDAEIRAVAALEVDDSSGGLEISDVAGALRVRDSSGEVSVRGVRGDVWLADSSGGLDVRDVEGEVVVEYDSSGEIRVADVSGSVRVRRDSSGGIRVSGVGGDFTVDSDGSGGIRYSAVTGSVRIPPRDR